MLAPKCKDEITDIHQQIKQLEGFVTDQNKSDSTEGEKLKSLKEQRAKRLDELINFLHDCVNLNYKTLTRKSEYIHGQTMLLVEDKTKSFNSGITYIPNPPGKRAIYDIQQLSSGEKTIALLAF